MSAGVYTTNSPEACRHLADNCNAQIVLVENEELAGKFLSIKKYLPKIKAMVQWKGKPKSPDVISWAQFMEIGQNESDQPLQDRLSSQAINQCCTLIYTSGTTGPPKGVMCSQDQLTWVPTRYLDVMDNRSPEEAIISYLPLSHIAGLMTDVHFPMALAATTYFAEPDALKGSLGVVLKEVRPTIFLSVPRVWEKIHETIQAKAAESGNLVKTLGKWAKNQGVNYYEALRDDRKLSYADSMKYSIAKNLVHDKVRSAIGLDRCTYPISVSAPIPTDIMDYFMSLSMPISEAYGLSETTTMGTLSLIKPHSFKSASVGRAVSSVGITLRGVGDNRQGEGEICVRGRNVCMGYLKMPDKTQESLDNTGLLFTGDIGRIDDDGFLFVTGRLKELVITSGGENVPPVLIEDIIKRELPCISNCMLIGDRRKFLSMLLTLKSDVHPDTGEPLDNLLPGVIEWLTSLGSSAKTVTEAVSEVKSNPSGAVANAIEHGIQRYNKAATSNAQKIQKWRLLPCDFSLPTGELNVTLKLKRSVVLEKYSDLIESMYSPARDS